MGEVYLAKDPSTRRMVALKTLPENSSHDERRMKNFRNEAQTVSQINHQNILTVYDFYEEAGFIVTEYIEGETLRRKLQSGALDVSAAVAITRQIAAALEAAHARGVVHSDIKPENVIIRKDGLVKVLDFGIAKLAESGPPEDELDPVGFGSAYYMSPEQLRGEDVDARTDIWSLGVCLYEMLTGAPPFKGEKRIDTFAAILKDEPAPLDQHVPETIIKKALKKNRDQRYQTMREFTSDLESISKTGSKEEDPFNEWRRTSGRKIWAILLACAISSCVVAAVLALIDSARSAQAVACIFHLIAITLAFLHLRKNPGPQGFRDLEYDMVQGSLKSHITYATGYERVSDWERAREIAKEALKYYRDAFKWLLFSWFFLYLWVLISLGDYKEQGSIVASVLTLANNFNTLCIWLCFAVLNEPITTEDKTQNQKAIIVKEGRKWPAGFIPAIVVMIFWFILELWLTSRSTPPDEIHYVSRVISGLGGGVAMALFVGRFQSKFLKSPTWLVFTLFLYTVIQALFIFYGDKSTEAQQGAAVVMNAALVLKCLLILYMFWLFQSGRLLFYLVRVRRAATQVDSEWQNFREVLQPES